MKVLLFQPEIPQNTGNIIRSCQATGAELILIRPLGFSLSSSRLKRAGLDYTDRAIIREYDQIETALDLGLPFHFFSSKTTRSYDSISYDENHLLIFGNETSGLPQEIHEKYPDHFATIPMPGKARCLNLSNAVAIVLYEALRQHHFFAGRKR